MSVLSFTMVITAAVAMAALSVWILYLKFGSVVNRSFAAYLLLYSGVLVLFSLAQEAKTAEVAQQLQQVAAYFDLSVVPALAYFGVAFFGWRSGRRLVALRAAILVAGVMVLALHAMDPCLRFCVQDGTPHMGPFTLLARGTSVTMGLLALLMAADWVRRGNVPGKGGAVLLAVAFMVNAFFDGSLYFVTMLRSDLTGVSTGYWADMLLPWRAMAMAPAAAALLLLVAGHRRGLLDTSQVTGASVLAGVAVASGIVVGVMPDSPSTLLTGTWRIVVPLMAAYALVYHRLFGIEIHIRRALGRTVLACLLIAVLFAAQQGAEALWPGFGVWVALAAAAAIALGISPLDRLGQRMASALMPHARPSAELGPEDRTRLYRDRVSTILADGRMALQDRILLDRLREQLALPPEWAARIERDAWAQAARPRKGALIESHAGATGAQGAARGRP